LNLSGAGSELPGVRHFQIARRAGVPAVAAAIGALIASPALADVTVTPATAEQGAGENVTFHVTNTGAAPLGTITLRLPEDTPVAEVYPLSVDRWAPKIEMRTLATPLTTIHGGTPATETTRSITWLAMPGHALAAGAATDLSVAIGPLPTLSSMQFTITSTYADGKPGPTMPAALTLTPAPAGQAPAAAGHAHGGADATGPAAGDTSAEDAVFQAAVADATRGPSVWAVLGWVIAGLALLGGAVTMLRNRHRAEDDEPDDEDETGTEPAASADAATDEREPVAAGPSKWSFKG
jgi:uncharacterized protein DUF1775